MWLTSAAPRHPMQIVKESPWLGGSVGERDVSAFDYFYDLRDGRRNASLHRKRDSCRGHVGFGPGHRSQDDTRTERFRRQFKRAG